LNLIVIPAKAGIAPGLKDPESLRDQCSRKSKSDPRLRGDDEQVEPTLRALNSLEALFPVSDSHPLRITKSANEDGAKQWN